MVWPSSQYLYHLFPFEWPWLLEKCILICCINLPFCKHLEENLNWKLLARQSTNSSSYIVHKVLNERFPEHRMRRGSLITWLPMLPDLMPFDSFLGAYVRRDKNRSSGQVANIDELKELDITAVKTKAPEVMHAQLKSVMPRRNAY